MKKIFQNDYKQKFKFKAGSNTVATDIQKRAFEEAVDIRKFEIKLYWTRAAHFWTLIGATFAAYALMQRVTKVEEKVFLSISVSCIGLLFSFAWYCVNRGSKYWQENWENHVALLEDNIVGPLYKTILSRDYEKISVCEKLKLKVNGPFPYSVSKINQIVSGYVTIFWCLLIIHSTPFSFVMPSSVINFIEIINWSYAWPIMLTLLGCYVIVKVGKTDIDDHYHTATMYLSKVK